MCSQPSFLYLRSSKVVIRDPSVLSEVVSEGVDVTLLVGEFAVFSCGVSDEVDFFVSYGKL